MNRRDFCKYAVVSSLPLAQSRNADAFLLPFLALIGRASFQSLARVVGATRASALASAAGRARFSNNPQFTIVPLGNTGLLRPRLRISNIRTTQPYRSPTIFIRELNLTLNEQRDITIQPVNFPVGYVGDYDAPLGNLIYRRGCDYLREISSVDECGCEARWQPEALSILDTPSEPPPGRTLSPPTLAPRDGPITWRPGDHNPCAYAGTVPIEWINGSIRCGYPR